MKKDVEMRQVQTKVENVLDESVKARNSDKELIKRFASMYCTSFFFWDLVDEMPAFETITRARRKIQAEGRFLSDKIIMKQRAENETLVRDWSVQDKLLNLGPGYDN